jgi:hypothetical protein
MGQITDILAHSSRTAALGRKADMENTVTMAEKNADQMFST